MDKLTQDEFNQMMDIYLQQKLMESTVNKSRFEKRGCELGVKSIMDKHGAMYVCLVLEPK